MATIAFAAAGAAVGSAFGATALGFQIGAMVGSYLMTPDVPPMEGPRLTDLTPQSADYGGAIPKVFGTMRVGSQVIGSTDIIETKHEEDYGGKGGPSYTQTTYTYSITMALALCEGEIDGIRNIYANGQLIWTADESKMGSLDNSVPSVKIYYGSESQEPDPAMESIYGAGNVPAYRGMAYVVFTNFQLGEYGNQVPSIEAEVVVSGVSDGNKINELVDVDNGTAWEVADYEGNTMAIARMAIEDGITTAYFEPQTALYWNIPSSAEVQKRANAGRVVYFSSSGEVIGTRPWNALEKQLSAWRVIPQVYNPDYAGYTADAYHGSFVNLSTFTAAGTAVISAWKSNKLNAGFSGSFINPDGVRVYYDTKPKVFVGRFGAVRGYGVIPEFLHDYDGYITLVALLPDRSGILLAWGPTPTTTNNEDTEGWCIIDPDGGVTRQGTCGPNVKLKAFIDNYDAHISFESSEVFYLISRYGNFGISAEIQAYAIDYNDEVQLLKTDGSAHVKDTLHGLPRHIQAKGGACFSISFDHFQVFTRLPRLTSDDYGVSQIISTLCEQGGLSASDIDVSAITDTVRGYARARSMPIRGAIEPLQKARFFDAVESDWKLKFVPRGGSSVVSVPEDDLCANTESSSSDDAVAVTRKQDMELPFEVTVKYIDQSFDYQPNAQRSQRILSTSKNSIGTELPLSLSADDAAQISEVLLFNAWQQRTTFGMKLPPKYEYLDPTDVITVTENGNVHTLRITNSKVGDYLDIDAVAEQASVYASDATGLERDSVASLAGAGPTIATPLDIPLLRTVDDTVGFYVAVSGLTDKWNGAIWYSSNDSGTTYSQERTLARSSVQGYVGGTLSTTALAGVIDYVSTITVGIGTGTLSSITDAQLLDGVSNAAAIGQDGQWELIQFKNATLNADGTYTLDTFVRGRKGTEWAIPLHEENETFVLLNNNLTRVTLNADEIGIERYYKAVTFNKLIENTPEQSFALAGVALKPLSPSHLAAEDNGDGTFDVTWIRRDRLSGEWRDFVDVPMSEETELYRVIVERAGSQISSTDVSSETATVTATTADVIKVAQVSAIVGAGYYSEITV